METQIQKRKELSAQELEQLVNSFINNSSAGVEYQKELLEIIQEEGLQEEQTKKFMALSFEIGYVPTLGMRITNTLPYRDHEYELPKGYEKKVDRVSKKLVAIFKKYIAQIDEK